MDEAIQKEAKANEGDPFAMNEVEGLILQGVNVDTRSVIIKHTLKEQGLDVKGEKINEIKTADQTVNKTKKENVVQQQSNNLVKEQQQYDTKSSPAQVQPVTNVIQNTSINSTKEEEPSKLIDSMGD